MTSIQLRTKLCEILDIRYPICLAGMGSQGRATPPALVAAVSEAGGLGVIGGAGLSAARLRAVIREVRTLTARPIGVNLVLPQAAAKAELDRDRIRREILEQFPEHAAFVRDLAKGFGLELVELDSRIAVSGAATADGTDAGLRGSRSELTRSLIDVVLDEDVQVFAGAVGDLKLISEPAHKKRMPATGCHRLCCCASHRRRWHKRWPGHCRITGIWCRGCLDGNGFPGC
ncbi:nitronate monooxygenase [Ensifer sp. 2YAB10]|uniref:nitronate monooxygenase n=1 Tax=Ensifer sp. 2YAB10 TaxID=3233021 RepID=UPI003F93BC2B